MHHFYSTSKWKPPHLVGPQPTHGDYRGSCSLGVAELHRSEVAPSQKVSQATLTMLAPHTPSHPAADLRI